MSKLLILVAASLVLAMPAAAQSSPQAQPIPLPAGHSDVNKIVCERQEEIGSRLKGKKVCMTVEQWQAFKATHREETEEMQRNANTRPSG